MVDGGEQGRRCAETGLVVVVVEWLGATLLEAGAGNRLGLSYICNSLQRARRQQAFGVFNFNGITSIKLSNITFCSLQM